MWLYLSLLFPISVLSFYIYKEKRRKCITSIVVFSRYPQPGTTKTRLIPVLGKEGAAYSQLLMTNHIVQKLKELSIIHGNIDLDIWYNGGTKKDMLYWMKERRTSKARVSVQEQPKGGLGDKLQQAASKALSQGRQHVIIIGSDIPGINGDIIEAAIDKLKNGSDMVLGPAADGGYYLVGFSTQAQKHLDSVFKDIDWGTERVFKQQSDKARSLGINMDILPQTLHDVDLEEDIVVIEKELGIDRLQLTKWSWSVVIPTLNEEDTIEDTLDLIVQRCSDVTCLAEIVICDGGSKDNTETKVKEFSERTKVKVKFIKCRAGRGFQLKEGTRHATGDHLLFVHSDSVIPRNYDEEARKCLLKPGNIAGAYRLAFDAVETPIS
ncbi:hypothetical protein FSP39_004076 [Pinctada imbricata]|uniref:Glycosyltransferase 2-like domain-containing protein n=1 Tax=Pinctada imbricata TaxID=66713 RepID=A0AA89BYM3_PINIB|nr:hypothetical protein FSP39_004076 [Pinctada imbricata]